jgi:hypothetical protein
MDERDQTIADLELPDADAEHVQGGIVTDNKDPDGRYAVRVIEPVSQKY